MNSLMFVVWIIYLEKIEARLLFSILQVSLIKVLIAINL